MLLVVLCSFSSLRLIEVIKETTKIKNVPKICPTSTEQIVPGSEGVMVPIYTTDKLINPIEPGTSTFCLKAKGKCLEVSLER